MGCQLGQRNDGEWVVLRAPGQFALVPVGQRLDAKAEAHTEAVALAAVDAGIGIRTVVGQQRKTYNLHQPEAIIDPVIILEHALGEPGISLGLHLNMQQQPQLGPFAAVDLNQAVGIAAANLGVPGNPL